MSLARDGSALLHAAGYYASPRHLLAQLEALVRDALDRGEPVVLGLQPTTDAALRASVGADVELVSMPPPDGPDGYSGQTVVAGRARELRRIVAEAGPVTVVTQHWSRFDGPDGRFWTEVDAAANIALWDLPARLTCFFSEMPRQRAVLDAARLNHPLVLVGDRLRRNPDYREPRDVLAVHPVPSPPGLGPPDRRMTFGLRQLAEVRSVIEQTLLTANVERQRAEDVALAVNEVATNALQHGAERAQLSLWAEPDGHVFEVHDRGVLDEPLPGLRPPHPAERGHRGLWIARQLCDCLHVWVDDDGTHVRIYAA